MANLPDPWALTTTPSASPSLWPMPERQPGALIEFKDGDATKMSLPTDEGIFIANPPYGQRMMEQKSAQRLYADLGRHLRYADALEEIHHYL